jgi:neutral trehalase
MFVDVLPGVSPLFVSFFPLLSPFFFVQPWGFFAATPRSQENWRTNPFGWNSLMMIEYIVF